MRGINDGAASIVLATAEAAEKAGLKPKARVSAMPMPACVPKSWASGRCRRCRPCSRARPHGRRVRRDRFERGLRRSSLAVNKGLGLDTAKVNPNGGAIALGHPVGATGAVIAIKAMYELERIGGRNALVTM